MKLALFDFDGTIYKADSFIDFIRFVKGDFKTLFGIIILAPMLIMYKLKFISNHAAKIKVFTYFFKGMNVKLFKKLSVTYSLNYIDKNIRTKAIEEISKHKNNNNKLVVVSASIECWLKPWCDSNGLDLIATQIEIKNGVLTGRFYTKNCYGKEKLKRLKELYNLSNYEYIYAYGDSIGDKELLELADESFFKPFR
ncbi:HAD-IB family hydrolase [Flavobacteriaceae bacterium]|nr:HAD-IB family hydrolase [Flavobacteriaceae bacterium]